MRNTGQQAAAWGSLRRGAGLRRVGLSASLVLAACALGCAASEAISTRTQTHAEFERERTELVRQYRECLLRQESDPSVDCSNYREAVEAVSRKR